MRGDGMYQFYIPILGCIDYLDVDSTTLDLKKILKYEPNFKVYTFKENEQFLKNLKNNIN